MSEHQRNKHGDQKLHGILQSALKLVNKRWMMDDFLQNRYGALDFLTPKDMMAALEKYMPSSRALLGGNLLFNQHRQIV